MSGDSLRDLYAVLGVSHTASQRAIKRAYRQLALQFHPDSSSEEASADRFREIEAAYEVLRDPARRQKYDQDLIDSTSGNEKLLELDILMSQHVLPVIDGEQMFYVLAQIRGVGRDEGQRLPLNLCLVIDRSTSMAGSRLESVKSSIHHLVSELDAEDTLGIVSFSDRAEVLMP